MELEQHVDCMIIWDHWEHRQTEDERPPKKGESGAGGGQWTEDLLEMWFYGAHAGAGQEK